MKKYFLVLVIVLAALLRLYKIGSFPPSLYWDEASLGYNAYSILKTGHDEHGKFFPITNFSAFGDYKPPIYIYATVPSIFIFGLNEFAIRFPSALFGVLTVLLTYFLTKKISNNEAIALLATLFLAISPWHIQLSRAAFEGNVALFFSALGIFLFLKFAKDNSLYIFPSTLSFIAAMYTFTGQRLFVPLIFLVLLLHFKKEILKNTKTFAVSAVLGMIIFLPLFIFATQTQEGRLRFNEVTIFKDLQPINTSNEYRSKDNFSWWSNIIHNRRLQFSREYLIHYFDAFNPNFLFIRGDVNPRFSTQETGELYVVDLVLILAGLYYLFSRNQKYRFLIVGWLLISPLGPATARETPHALRMIHVLPTFQIIAAFGVYYLYSLLKFKKAFIVLLGALLSLNIFFFLHMYFTHWAKDYSGQWQYGYKEVVNSTKDLYGETDYFVITKSLGRPYIYFLLYNKYDPTNYLKTKDQVVDDFYFIDVNGFDKFRFVNNLDEADGLEGRIIYVTTPSSKPQEATSLKTVKQPDGQTVFEIWKND